MVQGKGFVDFVLKAQKSVKLTEGFMEAKTSKKLKTFFEDAGFTDISLEDCKKLLRAKKLIPPKLIRGMY